MLIKALIDTNILVSASIYYVSEDIFEKGPIKAPSYDECKTLLNYFEKNIDEKIGLYTEEIATSAKNNIRDAINRTIQEIKKIGKIFNEKKLMEQFEVIVSSCIVRLENNKKNLVLVKKFDKSELAKLNTKVYFFYNNLRNIIKKNDPELQKVRILKSKIKRKWIKIKNVESSVPPHYYILKEKFVTKKIDLNDICILSQAIYLKKHYSKEDINFIFVSKDYHFIAIEKDRMTNDFIPNKIKQKFELDCLNPKTALERIKNHTKK